MVLDVYAIPISTFFEVRKAVALAVLDEFIDYGETRTTLLVDTSYVGQKVLERAYDILLDKGIVLTLHEYQYIVGWRQNAKVAGEDVIRYALPILKKYCGGKVVSAIKSFNLLVLNDYMLDAMRGCRRKIEEKHVL